MEKIHAWETLNAARARLGCLGGQIGIEAVEPRMVRLVYQYDASGGHPDLDWSSTIAVVNRHEAAPNLQITETDTKLQVRTGEIVLEFGKEDGRLKAGLVLTGVNLPHDLAAYHHVTWQPGSGIVCSGSLSPASHVFGLGETTGFLDKRGEQYVLWNTDANIPHVPETPSLYQSIPLLLHFENGQAYGVFFDYPGELTLDMRSQPDQYRASAPAHRLDVYLIFGPSLKEAVSGYTRLTGRMELPPVWALGYHQSRYSYKTSEEVLDIARTFREKQIPLDAIHLDIHYMDGFRVFTFDPVRFANPGELMDKLAEMGVHAVPIVDPGVKKDENYPVYQEGVQNGYFVRKPDGELFTGEVWPGESVFPDFTHPDVRRWWGNLYRFYTDLGIKGIWNDMNEPGIFDRQSQTLDPDVMHDNDGHPKTHAELHNLYGLQMTRAAHESLGTLLGHQRPFIISRAGYAGIQRYACVWTGDNRSYWEHLAMSIPMILNLGLSGIAFTGADIGGYGHHATGELLARWTQLGAFYPFCRNHNEVGRIDQEPWRFGERIEDICRRYIELRYRWMPHLYNLFREAALTGLPIWRPMVLEYPHDEAARTLCDQFLIGADVLAAPAYRPDTACRAVYLPEGAWYNYWTNECISGRRHVLADAPLDIMPLFIRAGAILPERNVRQFAADTSEDDGLAFRVYLPPHRAEGMELAYELYEDDGLTDAYKHGAYNLLRLEVRLAGGQAKISCRYIYQNWGMKRDQVKVRIIGLAQAPGKLLEASGSERMFHYDRNTATAEFDLKISPGVPNGESAHFDLNMIL